MNAYEDVSRKFSLKNINDAEPDICDRSLRYHTQHRKGNILRDTYKLIEPGKSPSRKLTLGYTLIYPECSNTGHSHNDLEEVYFILQGKGVMQIDDVKFPVKEGDAFYIPPNAYHITYNTGIIPLVILWVTGKID